MLTIEQIRAARALLDWSQQDLAEHANLSQTGIARIENGTNKPNSKTLHKIETAFDRNDIEFIGTTGVKKRTNEILVLSGKSGFERFVEDVYETVRISDETTCVSNVDERNFDSWLEKVDFPYLEKMEELKDNRTFPFHIIVQKDDDFTLAKYAEYRQIDGRFFGSTPFYVYGSKLAIILFEDDVTVYVINNNRIANAQRRQFEASWENAEKV